MNRVGNVSEVVVVNENNWSAKTFKVISFYEPGFTSLDVIEVSTPQEVVNTLETLRQNLTFLTEQSSAFTKFADNEFFIEIPSHVARSASDMFSSGVYEDTITFLRSQYLVSDLPKGSFWEKLLQVTTPIVIVAIFVDDSTMEFELITQYSTVGFAKVVGTAQKSGLFYNANNGTFEDTSGQGVDGIAYSVHCETVYTNSGGGLKPQEVCWAVKNYTQHH
ncbi:hypothetical protein GCM10007894_28690 [Paraferrimonas haliotis]|uniref:Uncharacterized protein n=2 Tax=Paraferrimonas haliotis TaxID=2013866 RepID=A0AA37TNU2_9GAMM|nr:hypothetical protein GCM10007894_28690 [Paraferrimonas haliotis]